MGTKIDISQAPAWLDTVSDKLQGAIQRGLYSAGLRVVSHIVNELIPAEPRVPVDKGIYRSGWRVGKLPNGVYVHNVAPHANIIEKGVPSQNVKIGRKMIDALTEWVKRKGIVKAKGKSPAAKASAELEARNVAWAIAVSMKNKGIFQNGRGLRILEKAEKKIPEFVRVEVTNEVKRLGTKL